jgi:hypothetical protein
VLDAGGDASSGVGEASSGGLSGVKSPRVDRSSLSGSRSGWRSKIEPPGDAEAGDVDSSVSTSSEAESSEAESSESVEAETPMG